MPKFDNIGFLLVVILAFLGGWCAHLVIKPDHFACRALGSLCRYDLLLTPADKNNSEIIDIAAMEEGRGADRQEVDFGESFVELGGKLDRSSPANDICPPVAIAEKLNNTQTKVKSTRELFSGGEFFKTPASSPASEIQYYQNILAGDPEPQRRSDALESLILLNNTDALAVALGDENRDIRLRVIEGLQNIASDSAILLLGQAVISDSNSAVRLKAIDALAALSYDINARQFLLWMTEQESQHLVRQAAISALE